MNTPAQQDAEMSREPIDRKRFEQAPCYLCGHNGPRYYQPDSHPCAARYHYEQPPSHKERAEYWQRRAEELTAERDAARSRVEELQGELADERNGREADRDSHALGMARLMKERDEAIAQRDSFKAKYDTLVRESNRTCYVCDACGRLRTTRECIVCERDEAIAQRSQWQDLFIRVAKALGCLHSLFPDGNGHVIGAATKLRARCEGVGPVLSAEDRASLAVFAAMLKEDRPVLTVGFYPPLKSAMDEDKPVHVHGPWVSLVLPLVEAALATPLPPSPADGGSSE